MIANLKAFLLTPLEIGSISFFFSPLQAILRFVLPLVLLFVVARVLLVILKRVILKQVTIPDENKQKIYRYIRLVLRIVVLIVLLFIVFSFFGAEIGNFLARVWEVLTTPFTAAGSSRISVITILLAIPIVYLASWVSKLTRRFLDATVLQKLTITDASRFTISSLVRYGVLILAILIGLSIIGINLSSLAVVIGALGIGIGFGLQNVVANYVAGLVIFFERPVKEGDRILVNGLEGDVVQIKLRSTVINTLTNETIIVPNSQLVGNSIHNYSYNDRRIIVVNRVQVSYSTDLDRALEVLLDVASRNPYSLKDMAPGARVGAFQDSGIEMVLWTWIDEATNKLAAGAWNNLEIWRAFKQDGIVIPFPQVDLHVKEPIIHQASPEK
ncbi:MAG: mechanosensitive ion channel [Spirochaetaceae bacterium]|nr:MAG: mechanosensitive ion channel [Spirochaetaceae bacterium]